MRKERSMRAQSATSAVSDAGGSILAYMESPDFAQALSAFAQSKDEFDVWFKQQMAQVTGVDLNNPPPGPLSEQLSSYAA